MAYKIRTEVKLSDFKIAKVTKQVRKFLLLLLSYPGKTLDNVSLCEALDTVRANTDGACRENARYARKLLNKCINDDENADEGVPQIEGGRAAAGYGVHTIKLPEEAMAAKTWVDEYPEALDLAKNYWRQYSVVRPYKNVGYRGYQDNIPFHEVYRIPRLQAEDLDCTGGD